MTQRVSLIVPIYNVENYLEQCILSIINQTYKNIEVVLVDDGSSDNCGKICDEYALKYNFIHVIHKKNGGLSSARNAGINYASGDYFAFIDSDDIIAPYYVQNMLYLAIKYSADLVCCDFQKGENFNKWEEASKGIVIREDMEIEDHMYDDDVKITVAWNKLYSSYFFKELGLRYPNGKIHEDMFLTPKILYYAKRMVITNDILYFYRIRNDSIILSSFSTKKLDKLEAIESTLRFFEEHGKLNLMAQKVDDYVRNIIYFYRVMLLNRSEYSKNLIDLKYKIKTTKKKYLNKKYINVKTKIKMILWRVFVIGSGEKV